MNDALYSRLRPLGSVGQHLETICNSRVGIINELFEVPIEPGAPAFFHYASRACNTEAFSQQRNFFQTGGAALCRETAIAKAVGEGIERYCAALYDREALPIASANCAEFRCADPDTFALFSSDQMQSSGFPWIAFSRDTSIRWTAALDLGSQEPIHVPAAFVWVPYVFVRGGGDAPIGQPISTGLACHGSRERAILSGLFEVVERDCFTIAWQAGISPPRIRAETVPDDAYEMIRRFEVTGDRVVLLDISSDNRIPCILSVLLAESPDRPARVFAASADLDPSRALAKALEELAHTRRYSQQIKKYLPPVAKDNDWEGVVTQMDHLNFAADHSNVEQIDVLLGSSERRAFSDYVSGSTTPSEDVAEAVRRIETTGSRVIGADLTSSDVAALGLHVWRIVIPGYHPLFMGHRIRSLGGTRLYEVPQRLGYSGLTPYRDRDVPHPYP